MLKKSLPIAIAAILLLTSCAGANMADPLSVTQTFYEDWAAYEGDPVADRAYAESDLVTEAFADKTDALMSAGGDIIGDPVFCTLEVPEAFSAETEPDLSDESTTVVTVRERIGERELVITVSLLLTDDEWRIDSIHCPAAGSAQAR